MNGKKRNAIIIIVVMLVIGFAAVSTTLIINGIIGLSYNKEDFVVIFTNAILNSTEDKSLISENKKVIDYKTNILTILDDKSSLEYEITNTSKNYDARVNIECNLEEKDDINVNDYVDMLFTPDEMIVKAGKTKSGLIDVTMKNVVVDNLEIGLKCTLVATPIERDSVPEDVLEVHNRGTLMATPKDVNPSIYGKKSEDKFWYNRSNINKVVFENSMTPHEVFLNPKYMYDPSSGEYISDTEEDYIFDVSDVQDGSVMAYLVRNDPTDYQNSTYTLYIQSNGGIIANTDSSYLFYSFRNLSVIEGLEYFDTSNVTDMSHMFDMSYAPYGAPALVQLDLSTFDTSKVTNMSYMFNGNSSLQTLDVDSFNTSNVTDMSYMFASPSGSGGKLNNLNLSNFDTSNVTNAESMFYGQSSLETLDIRSFDLSIVENKNSMFYFSYASSQVIITVKDEATKNIILELATTLTEEQVIIAS